MDSTCSVVSHYTQDISSALFFFFATMVTSQQLHQQPHQTRLKTPPDPETQTWNTHVRWCTVIVASPSWCVPSSGGSRVLFACRLNLVPIDVVNGNAHCPESLIIDPVLFGLCFFALQLRTQYFESILSGQVLRWSGSFKKHGCQLHQISWDHDSKHCSQCRWCHTDAYNFTLNFNWFMDVCGVMFVVAIARGMFRVCRTWPLRTHFP